MKVTKQLLSLLNRVLETRIDIARGNARTEAFILPASQLIMWAYSLSLQLKRVRTFPRVWVNVKVNVHVGIEGKIKCRSRDRRERRKLRAKSFILCYSLKPSKLQKPLYKLDGVVTESLAEEKKQMLTRKSGFFFA